MSGTQHYVDVSYYVIIPFVLNIRPRILYCIAGNATAIYTCMYACMLIPNLSFLSFECIGGKGCVCVGGNGLL